MASIIVNTKALRDALQPLQGIIPKKTHREALKCVHVTATTDPSHRVELRVTDLEVFALFVVEGSDDEGEERVVVNATGDFLIPAQTFGDYLKAIDDDTIELVFSKEDEILRIKANSTVFELGAIEQEEFPVFPTMPSFESRGWAELATDSLTKVLDRVLFAAADRGHPKFGALNAVCIEVAKDQLTFMSTDQVRASIATFKTQVDVTKQLLVDPKGLAVIPKIFTEDLRAYLGSDESVVFASGSASLFVRLIHGKYPPVKNFIPQHYSNGFSITAQEWLKQVKKVSLATDQNNELRIHLDKNHMKLLTKTREQRKHASVDVDVVYPGPAIKFALNCTALMQLLKAADNEEELEVSFGQSHDPIYFKQTEFDHVVVPREVRQ